MAIPIQRGRGLATAGEGNNLVGVLRRVETVVNPAMKCLDGHMSFIGK
jgi:hypothetical protein